ncbi:MAG: type II toxin-antitoxin system HicA family toxin [Candidatus Komeilibacteria bacterium]|nr:type II toxin-antitoxin system HicA family toxin [Candidatus Komeilibacteria bacterium]
MQPVNIPSDASQKRIIKAFKKIGFVIERFGKGSHILVTDPKSGATITVQHRIYKEVIRSYCQALEKLGYDSSEFIKYL